MNREMEIQRTLFCALVKKNRGAFRIQILDELSRALTSDNDAVKRRAAQELKGLTPQVEAVQ